MLVIMLISKMFLTEIRHCQYVSLGDASPDHRASSVRHDHPIARLLRQAILVNPCLDVLSVAVAEVRVRVEQRSFSYSFPYSFDTHHTMREGTQTSPCVGLSFDFQCQCGETMIV